MQPVNKERGAAAIVVAASLMLLLGLAALAVDIGIARNDRLELQNAADAGALAGAFEIPDDASGARSEAADYAFAGVAQSAPGATTCGTDTECFNAAGYRVVVTTPYSAPGYTTPPDQLIHVRMCSDTPTFFGRILGADSLTVCGEAVATAAPGVGPCALCILSPSGTTFSSTGAGTVNVTNGSIVVNSADSKAVSLTGSGHITTDQTFGIHGGYSATAGALTPTPTYHDPVPDPLAALPAPNLPGSPAPKVSISGSSDVTLSPGIYSEIVSSSSGQITLQPGVYVVTRQIKLSKSPAGGKVSVLAHGVTIFFACQNYPTPCAPGESGANLSMSGGTSVSWTPPTSGSYQGISMFADRNNTASFTLTGSSGSSFSGSIYMKSGTLSLTGSSGVTTAMDSMIVVGSFKKTGDSSVNVVYDPSTNSPVAGGSGDRRLVG